MKTIAAAQITKTVKELVIKAAHDLEPDILEAIIAARDKETSSLAKSVLELLIQNCDIASREMIPACQDTGICSIFVALGQNVHLSGDFNEAVQEGVRQGYSEGFLRKSVCDVISRKNTGTNTPAVIHVEIVAGDKMRIAFLPKGCGSENMSALKMLPPSAGISGALDFIVRTAVEAGPNPCPPLLIGAGIGGTFEKVAIIAKKALLRPLGQANENPEIAGLERDVLRRINQEGGGVHGFGGCNTALGVHIDTFPTHIASLPVAVNIQCHSHRYKIIDL